MKERAGVSRHLTVLELTMQNMIDDYRRQIGEINKRIDELRKRDNLVDSLSEMLYGVERKW
mgnify:CR=1 FL=1